MMSLKVVLQSKILRYALLQPEGAMTLKTPVNTSKTSLCGHDRLFPELMGGQEVLFTVTAELDIKALNYKGYM